MAKPPRAPFSNQGRSAPIRKVLPRLVAASACARPGDVADNMSQPLLSTHVCICDAALPCNRAQAGYGRFQCALSLHIRHVTAVILAISIAACIASRRARNQNR